MKTHTRIITLASTITLALTACAPAPEPVSLPPAVPEEPTITQIDIAHTPDWENTPTTDYSINCLEPTESNYPMDSITICRWLNRELPTLATANYGELCTQQYGGPNQATITVYQTRPPVAGLTKTTIDLARHNGCAINQWEDWSMLLLPLEAELPKIKGPIPPR